MKKIVTLNILAVLLGSVAVLTAAETVPSSKSDKIDWTTPRNILEKEADKNNPEALYYIAFHSASGGNGFVEDEAKKVEFYEKGAVFAAQGSPAAQCCRAICYIQGYGVTKNEKEAVKWFRKAAEQGFAPAQSSLGICYRMGAGVNKDEKEAVKWFRKAAEQGLFTAQYALAIHYYSGKANIFLVEVNCKMLAIWKELYTGGTQCHALVGNVDFWHECVVQKFTSHPLDRWGHEFTDVTDSVLFYRWIIWEVSKRFVKTVHEFTVLLSGMLQRIISFCGSHARWDTMVYEAP